jgi:PIN domain nuclease of toxin-antitoxin system
VVSGGHPLSALLLDTHAWIWLAAGDRRLAKHERILNRAAEAKELLLSAVSIYEAALIGIETDGGRRHGKQAVKMRPTVPQWIHDAIRGTRVWPVALEPDTALDGATLHAMHPDPFDRLIVATATSASARLVTADVKMIAFAKRAGVALLEV